METAFDNKKNECIHKDSAVISLIKNGDKAAFDKVFLSHFKQLHTYACAITRNENHAEEIVQNVFFRIWIKRDLLKTDGHLKSYLYRSVYNEAMNHMKYQKVRNNFSLVLNKEEKNFQGDLINELMANELERKVQRAISELPERCRIIFQLSRFELRKYHEIARELNISIKTVENQMGKALKQLRLKLSDFIILILILLN